MSRNNKCISAVFLKTLEKNQKKVDIIKSEWYS
jgi:hypothetical protein